MPHRTAPVADPHSTLAPQGVPRLVVFDVAGTTVRDEGDAVATCVCAALAADGLAVPLTDVDPVMGMPKPLAIRTLLQQHEDRSPDPLRVQRIYRDFESRMIDHYAQSPAVAPMPNAEALFNRLHTLGCRVALDTGFARPILDTILDRFGWRRLGLIDDTVTSDEVENGRPDPEMIHVLMGRAQIEDPARVWKVGDSISDLEQGLAARCALVAAMPSTRTAEAQAQFPSVRAIEGLGDLLELLAAYHAPVEVGP